MDWKNKLQIEVDHDEDKIKENAVNPISFNFSLPDNSQDQSITNYINKEEDIEDIHDPFMHITSKDLEIAGFSVLAFMGLLLLCFPHTSSILNNYSFLGIDIGLILTLLKFFTFSAGISLLTFFIHEHSPNHFLINNFYKKYVSYFKPMKKKITHLFFSGLTCLNLIGLMGTIILPPTPINDSHTPSTINKTINTPKDIVIADSNVKKGNYQEMVDLANAQKERDALDKINENQKEYALNRQYLIDTLKLKQEFDKYNTDSSHPHTNKIDNFPENENELVLMKNQHLKSLSDIKEDNIKLKQELENMRIKNEIALLKHLQK